MFRTNIQTWVLAPRGILSLFVCATVFVLGFSPVSVWADGGAEHQVEQDQLGTSGGNINDRSMLWCCSGTLGALVEDGSGNQYILSNNHVLARTNKGGIGDDINQPGQVDQGCGQDGVVADLSDFVSIKFAKGRRTPQNEVDAAIALVRDGAVSTDGSILDIGTVSANTDSATVGQAVQKSGRTTGHTVGSVSAVGVTVNIGYSKDCGGAATNVAQFVNQIFITPGSYSAPGDSGSLIVESGTVDPGDGLPRAVGLLFAGSNTSTIANPINAVLDSFGVTMVGGTPVSGGEGEGEGEPEPEPFLTTIVDCIVYNTAGGRNNNRHLLITVKVVDEIGNPVSDAQVDISVNRNGSFFGAGSGALTDAAGEVTYQASNAPKGTYETTVTNVAVGVATFEGSTPANSFVKGTDSTPAYFGCAGPSGTSGTSTDSAASIDRAKAIKNRNSGRLFSIPGVVGHGVGLSDSGEPVIQVYLSEDSPSARAQIPGSFDDVSVEVVVTGPFVAF